MVKNIKKNQFWGVLVATLVAFCMTSCDKEVLTSDASEGIWSKSSQSMDSPYNDQNPFDSVGIMHNELLTKCRYYVYANMGDTIRLDNLDSVLTLANILLSEYDYDTTNVRSIACFVNDSTIETNSDLLYSMGLSENTVGWLSELIDELDYCAENEIEDVSGLIGRVYNKEFTLIGGEPDLFTEDNLEKLMATSVLRHSLYYWDTAVFHPDLYGEIGGTQYESEVGPKVKRVLRIALADAKGALKGGKEAYSLASIVGGSTEVCVVAGCAGAVLGAVEASIEMSEKCKAEDKKKVDEQKKNDPNPIVGDLPGNGGNN